MSRLYDPRTMPVELGWFLGTVIMLAAIVAAGVGLQANRRIREALASRIRTIGTIAKVAEVVDDQWLLDCTIEYVVDGHRYQISAELETQEATLGRALELMALPGMPSDAVLLRELQTGSLRWPIVTFCVGAALIVCGYLPALPK
jgi:hypothetical protein